MEKIFQIIWTWLNTNDHLFTIITVIASGLISLVISALYFKKSSRDALISDVFYPIKHILDDELSYKNYALLIETSKRYTCKYLHKKERAAIDDLISSYQKVYRYKYETVCADSLFSYFCYKLESNEILLKVIPIRDDNGMIIEQDYPDDLRSMRNSLAKIIEYHPFEFDEDDCTNRVISVYKAYCKIFSNKEIVFFDDHSINEVVKIAKNRVEWDKKLSDFNNAKSAFLNLKVFRDQKHTNHLNSND